MSNSDKKDTIKNEIQLITNHKILFTKKSGDHFYKGNLSTRNEEQNLNNGNFKIVNKLPISVNPDSINNIKNDYINTNKSYEKDFKSKINNIRKANYYEEKRRILNNFISRNHDNIVVLAGAGSSILETGDGHISKEGGLPTSLLAKRINKALDNDFDEFYSLIEMAIISNFYDFDGQIKLYNKNSKFTTDLKRLLDGYYIFNNFEDLMSNINEFKPFVNLVDGHRIVCNNGYRSVNIVINMRTYYRTIKEIHYFIRKFCHLRIKGHNYAHSNFISELQSLTVSDSRLKIYSTNYDTLFEQAANENKLMVIDGFDYTIPRSFNDNILNTDFVYRNNDDKELNSSNTKLCPNVIKIFQLHGAVNWYRNKNTKDVYKTTFENASSKIGKSTNDSNYESCMIFPSSNKYKQSYEDPYFDFFFNFQKDLRKRNTLLIIVGFSLSDNHIRRMVYNAMLANSSLNMIFLSHSRLSKTNSNTPLEKFYSTKFLPRELFYKGDLSTFTDDLDLNYIYNE